MTKSIKDETVTSNSMHIYSKWGCNALASRIRKGKHDLIDKRKKIEGFRAKMINIKKELS
jgi:ribosomal protein L34